jgi:ribonucleoside-triphosphate reductase
VKVLKAVSSPVRLNILNLLFDKGSLPYTDLMSGVKMNPNRDAGRFAYHLKVLLKTDLVEADVDAREYRLTDIGKMVVNIAGEIDRKSSKRRRILVRTSGFSLEDFDANKIVDSLVEEGEIAVDIAQKVAKQAERRLLKSRTKYLTAPLIREVVNAILIEKGLEEYRHKLTRLGLPVPDTASLIEVKSKTFQGSNSIEEDAGKAIFKEYTLLNILPRDVSDAHLSGSLHINSLSSWILKPSEVVHDLRFFLQNGLNLKEMSPYIPFYSPPKSFESALSLIFNVLLHSSKEVIDTQTIEYFNIFLAPFMEKLSNSEAKEAIRLFLLDISQHLDTSLALELELPDFIAEKEAIGLSGKSQGIYGDFKGESQILASLIIEVLAEESMRKPLFNPKIILKIRSETFSNDREREILLQAHQLASDKGIPYFANLTRKERIYDVFSASGYRLKADLKKDWEIDTLRTGNLGHVAVNLPRIVHQCDEDERRFFEVLEERLEIAARALEIKYRSLKQLGRGLIPFLTQNGDGDHYFRLAFSSRLIVPVGLKETAEMFRGKNIYEDEETLKFARKIAQSILDFTKSRRKHRYRLLPAVMPSLEGSRRLVKQDIEKYGIAKVRFSGSRKDPFYSTFTRLGTKAKEDYLGPLNIQKNIRVAFAGGNLTRVDLEEGKYNSEELMSWSERLVEKYDVEFFTYDRSFTHCRNCRKSWFGRLPKCPSCKATSTLVFLNRL